MNIPVLSGRRARCMTLAALLVAGGARFAAAQSGGPYDLTWNKMAAGGITNSSGGVYALGATIGQPDAGAASGGVYRLDGGFWFGLGSVQLVDVPREPAPARAVLSLHGLVCNPASLAQLQVKFSLASRDPAVLEVLDIAGRRVGAAEVGTLGPGSHVLDLRSLRAVASGLYWIRLRQSGEVRVAKAVVLR